MISLQNLEQIARWFEYAKEALQEGDADNAWSCANQGHLYTLERIREQQRPNTAKDGA